MAVKESRPGTAFNGVIGRTFDSSEQAWPDDVSGEPVDNLEAEIRIALARQ